MKKPTPFPIYVFIICSLAGLGGLLLNSSQIFSEPLREEALAVLSHTAQQLPQAIITEPDGALMRLIPSGEFTFGITGSDLQALQKSYEIHPMYDGAVNSEVRAASTLLAETKAFYMDVYEVTNAQYEKFLKATGHRQPRYWKELLWNQSQQPVVGIGWNDAAAYGKWAGKQLPNEVEWEKAARGTDKRLWPWGNDFGAGLCNSAENELGKTAAVGTYKGISPYGLFDMAGNVWEMCEGEWRSPKRSGPVMRGGCFNNDLAMVRTTVRWSPANELVEDGIQWLGFRCALDADKVRIGVNARVADR